MLKSVYLGFRKVKVQRVTVVEFGMYDRSGDGVGCAVKKTFPLTSITSRMLISLKFDAPQKHVNFELINSRRCVN